MNETVRERRIRRAAEQHDIVVDDLRPWRIGYREGVDRSSPLAQSPSVLHRWFTTDNIGSGTNYGIDVTSAFQVLWDGNTPVFHVESCQPGSRLHKEKDKAASRANRARNMGAGTATPAESIGPKRP